MTGAKDVIPIKGDELQTNLDHLTNIMSEHTKVMAALHFDVDEYLLYLAKDMQSLIKKTDELTVRIKSLAALTPV